MKRKRTISSSLSFNVYPAAYSPSSVALEHAENLPDNLKRVFTTRSEDPSSITGGVAESSPLKKMH